MRIVNKTKFIRACIILGILITMIIIVSTKTYSKGEIDYKTEYICRGDTLWNIASNEISNNEYYKNKDIRNVVNELQSINNLTDIDLVEGMKIKIPIYK